MDPMDRPIAGSEIRRKRIRRVAIPAAILLALAIGAHLILGLARPAVSATRIRTATVDRGPIEATISARGRVVPACEHIITSPIDSRVTSILMAPGSPVQAGEPIVALDVSGARLAVEKLSDQISLKQNERDRAHLALESTLGDLRGKRAIQELELESCRSRATRDQRLLELGVCSEDQANTSAADAERARIMLEQLEKSIVNAQRALEVEVEGLDLEIGILRKEHDEAARRLALASASADRDGVLTWVVPSVGAAVRQGDEIARIADLSAFRVEASVADVHAGRLSRGQAVEVTTGETHLRGTLTNILPTVENGTVTFEVTLDEPSHPVLRHNLRVDVYVVTAHKDDVLRVKRGAYVTIDGVDAVYVIHEDVAVRTPVEFGIANYEICEVVSGLDLGDEIITSDMKPFMRVKEVRVR